MADTTRLEAMRDSPLSHLAPSLLATEGGPAGLRELPFRTMVSLRVAPGTPAAERVEDALGLRLPTTCGSTGSTGAVEGRTALWFGPDEWLVVSEVDEPAGAVALLDAALAGDRGSVVDVSANRTTVELSGERARQVLEKGCALDLHPRALAPGRAVTSTLGPVPLVLWQTDEQTFRLLPRSSFADYLARWLLDAAAEFSPAAASLAAPGTDAADG